MLKPGIYPPHSSRSTSSHAEIAVYEALARQLPQGWYAWHSLRIRIPGGPDAEADFIIADPRRGILILEVKGGRIEERDGKWYSNDKPLAVAPRDQANRFKRGLIELCRSKGIRLPSCGIATCFPDTPFDCQPTQGDMVGCVLGKQDLPWLNTALQSLMSSALPRGYRPQGKWLQAIHDLWGETWIPKIDFGLKARLEKEERIRLDDEQFQVLQGMMENKSVLVTGAAGTGKTVLALALARKLADDGKRVLLLCFTEPLARWMQAEMGQANPAVRAIKRYAVELLEQAGRRVKIVDTPEFWSSVAGKALTEALPSLEPTWDAIVVDESQDLAEDDWRLVEKISNGKWLWAFWDPEQAFWRDRRVREDLFHARFSLRKRYRCPTAVTQLAGCYLGDRFAAEAFVQALEERVIAVRPCPGAGLTVEQIGYEIDGLLGAGFEPSDIAVLSLRGAAERGSIVHRQAIGAHRLARAHDEPAGSNVVGETFLRFKGLERPAIIVTDLNLAIGKPDYRKRMYIALTRALSTVRIVDTRAALAQDPFLAPLCS